MLQQARNLQHAGDAMSTDHVGCLRLSGSQQSLSNMPPSTVSYSTVTADGQEHAIKINGEGPMTTFHSLDRQKATFPHVKTVRQMPDQNELYAPGKGLYANGYMRELWILMKYRGACKWCNILFLVTRMILPAFLAGILASFSYKQVGKVMDAFAELGNWDSALQLWNDQTTVGNVEKLWQGKGARDSRRSRRSEQCLISSLTAINSQIVSIYIQTEK